VNKTEVIRAKATPVDRRCAELRASEEGLKLSEYVRFVIREDARRHGIFDRVLRELRDAA